MDPLIWAAIGIVFFLWIIYNWGRTSGISEERYGRKEETAKLEKEIKALKERIESEKRKHFLETKGLESAITTLKRQRDAFRPLGSLLYAARDGAPSWIHPDCFLLLGPGRLTEYEVWSRKGAMLWEKIEPLSNNARVIIEQACISDDSRPDMGIPLALEIRALLSRKPVELTYVNFFDLQSQDFAHFAEWLNALADASRTYVARASEIDSLNSAEDQEQS